MFVIYKFCKHCYLYYMAVVTLYYDYSRLFSIGLFMLQEVKVLPSKVTPCQS